LKYDILVRNKVKTEKCLDSKHLMDGLYVYEDLVPKGCHNGACGLCKIKVHSGDFEKSKMNRKHISLEEENENILLACKVKPLSEMEIEFIGNNASKEKNGVYVLGNKTI
jgi:ferredoxin